MALIGFQDLQVAWGSRPLLDNASLQIEKGERIGLIGRNGEGKSTLLRVLAGEITPHKGNISKVASARVTSLPQDVPADLPGMVHDIIRAGFRSKHDQEHEIDRLASVLEIDPEQPFASLSGGQKRRALLGRALAGEPDVLLLDEPTNHLDLGAIEWMETFLTRLAASVVFVTHDRAFLQKVATRIVELDRGRLSSWDCDYQTYLRRKEQWLAAEEEKWALHDKRLAQEEIWIRQGVKARRTRAEGRVRELMRLRKERAERRERVGSAKISIQTAERSGAKVIEAKDVTFAHPGAAPILKNFDALVMRGEKIGIIGPNGCGKTTLLNLLLGKLQPQSGEIEHGTKLEVLYFDQHRAQLDPEKSVIHNLSEGRELLSIDGKQRHVVGYLQDFLFAPERARQPVKILSGGERNRLLLARLFLSPSNVLVLDEPTNDLDTETLELLESRLVEYPGTVLVVSHDRTFLDNICTSTLVFEDGKGVREYPGGYSDWQADVKRRAAMAQTQNQAQAQAAAAAAASAAAASAPAAPARRLSTRERDELKKLPGLIEQLEKELNDLHAKLADPVFFKGEPNAVKTAMQRAADLPAVIEKTYARWHELEG